YTGQLIPGRGRTCRVGSRASPAGGQADAGGEAHHGCGVRSDQGQDRLFVSGSVRPWLPALAALAMLAGCSRQAPVTAHADWVIHSRIVFLMQDLTTARAALPLSQFRLVFPYIAGDLYGAPTTGDFVQPVIGTDYRL